MFSKDGRYLYGSSYYTGVSNIFRYEVATGAVEAVSNAEIGFFRPVPLADGRLVVLNYTADGFVPAIIDPRPIKDVSAITFLGAEIAEKYPVVKTWQVPPPSTVDDEKLITPKGPYFPLKHIGLANAFPVLQGYKNFGGIGYHFNFDDPLSSRAWASPPPTRRADKLPSDERGHVDIAGRYLFWKAALSWNRSDFYDLFGPTKRSRKGYAAKLGYDWLLIYDEPRQARPLLRFRVLRPDRHAARCAERRDQLHAAGHRRGRAQLHRRAALDRRGRRREGPRVVADLHWAAGSTARSRRRFAARWISGFALPCRTHRSGCGARAARPTEPQHDVANFYFGGFGNNYVDDSPIKRYREYYSLPGIRDQQISALNFVRELVELNLPPVVFESAGTPGFTLNWLRPSMFAAGLWTEPGTPRCARTTTSVGAQVDLRFTSCTGTT